MTLTRSKNFSIMVVDDETGMLEFLEILLEMEGYRVRCADSGRKAVKILEEEAFNLLLLDIRLKDISGIEVLKKAKEKYPDTVVIMISAYASAETAVEAMKAGAYDYVPKPFDKNELLQTIKGGLELKTIEKERARIKAEMKKTIHFGRIVGNSPQMIRIYRMIEKVAATRSNILISGESGTGKELIARAIHARSDRKEKPFVVINCAGIPESLMESELFGHVKGAFTGAAFNKDGLFKAADTGTVFLDEVGELTPVLQVKLLRVLQERCFKPVGSNQDVSVDIRIISATNKNLEGEVIAGRFREDLFYRLNVIEIKVPPLRERKDDIRLLSQHFMEKYCLQMGKKITKISSYAVDMLKKYDFPGNVRELENLMERSVALSETNILLPDSLALSLHKRQWKEKKENPFEMLFERIETGESIDRLLEEIEKNLIEKALQISGYDRQAAAELLKINMRSLRYRMEKLQIEKKAGF